MYSPPSSVAASAAGTLITISSFDLLTTSHAVSSTLHITSESSP
jgi:hypothetical protein